MELEFIAAPAETGSYPFEIIEGDPAVVDWRPMLVALLEDLSAGRDKAVMARRFHNSLIEIAVILAKRLQEPKVALSGGVFQNKILAEGIFHRLTEAGLEVHLHQRVPPNDGCISLGQIVVAAGVLEHGI
jgi:hydrogenase maturation protein HypF